MNLTHRQSDYIDGQFAQYLSFAEYREWTSSATPSVTGYVSDCCRSETRILRSGSVSCLHCGRICDTRSWHSPLSGTVSRGGWQPGIAETRPGHDANGQRIQVPTGRTWNVMYVNETRTRNTGATDARLAFGTEQIRKLTHLFEAPPRGMGLADWRRSKRAWEAWLGMRAYAAVAELAISAGLPCELWTSANVEQWIECARALAHDRLERAKDRPKEHPWSKVAWLVYQAETSRRRRKRAA